MGNASKHIHHPVERFETCRQERHVFTYFDRDKIYMPGDCLQGCILLKIPHQTLDLSIKNVVSYIRGTEIHEYEGDIHCCRSCIPQVNALKTELEQLHKITEIENGTEGMPPIRISLTPQSVSIKTNIRSKLKNVDVNVSLRDLTRKGESNLIVPFHFHIPQKVPPSFSVKWQNGSSTSVKYTVSFLVLYGEEEVLEEWEKEIDTTEERNRTMFDIISNGKVKVDNKHFGNHSATREMHFESYKGTVIWSETKFMVGSYYYLDDYMKRVNFLNEMRNLQIHSYYPLSVDYLKNTSLKSRVFTIEYIDGDSSHPIKVKILLKPNYIICGGEIHGSIVLDMKHDQCDDSGEILTRLRGIGCRLEQEIQHTHIFEETDLKSKKTLETKIYLYEDMEKIVSYPTCTSDGKKLILDHEFLRKKISSGEGRTNLKFDVVIQIPKSSQLIPSSDVRCYFAKVMHHLIFQFQFQETTISMIQKISSKINCFNKSRNSNKTFEFHYPVSVFNRKTTRPQGKCKKSFYKYSMNSFSDISIHFDSS